MLELKVFYCLFLLTLLDATSQIRPSLHGHNNGECLFLSSFSLSLSPPRPFSPFLSVSSPHDYFYAFRWSQSDPRFNNNNRAHTRHPSQGAIKPTLAIPRFKLSAFHPARYPSAMCLSRRWRSRRAASFARHAIRVSTMRTSLFLSPTLCLFISAIPTFHFPISWSNYRNNDEGTV